MVKSICTLVCSLTLGQLVERGDWQLSPQLSRGLELVYSGTYVEESLAPNVNHQKPYRLNTTLFVMTADKQHADVAIMTSLSEFDPRPTPAGTSPPPARSSVRFEQASVDRQGRLHTRNGKPLSVSVTGPSTLEFGFLPEVPLTAVGKNGAWEVQEEGRPARAWQVAGTEVCAGKTCVKLIATQQSDDWDHPRADQTAWRRKDTVWLVPQLNVAAKVERVVERRDPAHKVATHRSTVRYALDSDVRYPGRMFDDRQREIQALTKFQEKAASWLKQPAQHRTKIDDMLREVAHHIEHQVATPYRPAVLHFKQQLEAARNGELAVQTVYEEPVIIRKLGVGEHMPDFAIACLTEKQPVHLKQMLGRPTLIAFYNPATPTGRTVLLYAKELCEKQSGKVNLLAMAVTENAALARKQHAEMKLPFPILEGHALRLTLSVEHTPRFVILDGEGVIRWEMTGWGDHVPAEIAQVLVECHKR
jgi:hypothetical protein